MEAGGAREVIRALPCTLPILPVSPPRRKRLRTRITQPNPTQPFPRPPYTPLQSQMNLVLNTLQVSSCIPVSAEEITSYILHKNPHRQLDQDSSSDDDEDEDNDEEQGEDSTQNDAGGSISISSISSNQILASPTRGGGGGLAGGRDKASQSPQRRRAERAAMRSLRGHRQYIILDCRPREEFDSCRLAPALHLDPELLMSPEKLDAKLKEFMPLQVGK